MDDLSNLKINAQIDPKDNIVEDYFLNLEIDIEHTVTQETYDALGAFGSFHATATVDVTYLDGEVLSAKEIATTMLQPKDDQVGRPSLVGGMWESAFSGPEDDVGSIRHPNDYDKQALESVVDENTQFSWKIFGSSMSATNPVEGMYTYNWFFYPDANLSVDEIDMEDIYYRPNVNFNNKVPNTPLSKDVYASASIKYVGDDNIYQNSKASKLEKFETYSAEDLGIDNSKTIEYIWFHYYVDEAFVDISQISTNFVDQNEEPELPAGVNTLIKINTSVKDTTVKGEINAKAGYLYAGSNNNSTIFDKNAQRLHSYLYQPDEVIIQKEGTEQGHMKQAILPEDHNYIGINRFMVPKKVYSVIPKEGASRVLQSDIKLGERLNNEIELGRSKLELQLQSDISSLQGVQGPITAYVLLPEGINISKTQKGLSYVIIDEDYNGSGNILIKVSYNPATNLSPGKEITVSLDVEVTEDVSNITEINVFTFIDADYDIPKSITSDYLWNKLVKDVNDFDNDGDKTEEILHARSVFFNKQDYEYENESKVRNDKNVDFDYKIEDAGDLSVEHKISLTNKKLSAMKSLEFLVQLPDLNDKYLTHNIERGSEVKYKLENEIDTSNKSFEVLYTLEEIIYNEDYETMINSVEWLKASEVNDYDDVTSFIIRKVKNSKNMKEETIDFTFNTSSFDASEEDKKAYTSVITKVNNLDAMESSASLINKMPEDDSNEGLIGYSYTVIFDSQGGSDVDAIFGLREDSLIPEPKAPEKEGYNFVGWEFEGELWDFENRTIGRNKTLVARWEKKSTSNPQETPVNKEDVLPQTGSENHILSIASLCLGISIILNQVKKKED